MLAANGAPTSGVIDPFQGLGFQSAADKRRPTAPPTSPRRLLFSHEGRDGGGVGGNAVDHYPHVAAFTTDGSAITARGIAAVAESPRGMRRILRGAQISTEQPVGNNVTNADIEKLIPSYKPHDDDGDSYKILAGTFRPDPPAPPQLNASYIQGLRAVDVSYLTVLFRAELSSVFITF